MSYITARTAGAQGAPLVFTFHGTGGDERQFHGLASQMIPGARVVSPRGNVPEMGMNRYFRRTGEGVYDMDDLWARADAMAAFLADEKAKAGATRVIGLGYSNGANILIAVALRHPEIVDELILMHPLIPFTPDPQPALAGRKALVTAGRFDQMCPAPLTEAFEGYLKAQGVELTTHWHEGGHEIRQDELTAIQGFLGAVPA